jgi:hypothetical protein
MRATLDETATPLDPALVRAGRSGSGRRPALPNGTASATMIPLIDRRAFLATLTGSLVAAPLPAEGQPAGPLYRIGWLAPAANLTIWRRFGPAFARLATWRVRTSPSNRSPVGTRSGTLRSRPPRSCAAILMSSSRRELGRGGREANNRHDPHCLRRR